MGIPSPYVQWIQAWLNDRQATIEIQDYIPSSSPSIKRKHDESLLEYGKQMNDISNFLETVMKQQGVIVDGLQALRKRHEKIKKMTTSLLHANKLVSFFNLAFFCEFCSILDQVSANKPVQLPIYKYKEKNLFDSISADLSITATHCKLIRKLYSTEEIINGEALNVQDERFEIVKDE
ncbi:unnamed protein product [Rotaria sp. Silwood1]|nr:unnamed protein product [Rotaria sp. Silwood1]CAF1238347.1 unnamed protein product [Rotaria sp. Silwood1]CAF3459930.1 unnamed protein product [Rotaria sp. Silwood1]CAF3497787.1 unnamed protein product [Rotaria sp. Silwood1]CAF3501265.1 unnamed protein product [Rotaria sp. Silwood1]